MLVRSINMPVNAHEISVVEPPKNNGIPGKVNVNMFLPDLESMKIIGLNTCSCIFLDYIYCISIA